MLSKKRSVKAPTKSVATKRVAVKKMVSTTPAKAAKQVSKQLANQGTKLRKSVIVASKATPATKRPLRPRKKTIVSSATTADTVVLLEGAVSMRLQAKRQAYEAWFHNQSLQDLGRVASVFGYVFVITGLLLSAYMLGPNWIRIQSQSAALPCLDPALCTAATSTVSGPTVAYVTSPEVVPGKDLVVTTQIVGLDNPELIVVSDEVSPLKLEPTTVDSDVYTFRVPTTTFLPGNYRLRVEGETDNLVRTSFIGPRIRIDEVPKTTTDQAPQVEESEVASSTEQVTVVDWEVEPYRLSIRNVEAKNSSIVEFASMFKFEGVAIYARPDHGVSEFFLGQAENREETWVYAISHEMLPQGMYTLHAKGIDQNEVKGEALISFQNIVVGEDSKSTSEVLETTPLEVHDSPSTLLKALSIENHAGTTSELDQTSDQEDLIDAVSSSTVSSTSLPEKISSVITTFAVAKQTNNALLLRASETALMKAVMDEVRQVTYSNHLEPVEVATFENELQTMVKKEVALRVVNAQNSSEFYPVDTDQDGLSDSEEVISGLTDNTQPDTDRDGILDGVEMVFGYDPANYEPETVLRLEQSVEVPIIETLLGIESVAPYAFYADDVESPQIYQEISGFGIPNSFVLLRINDDEVVALVPVAANGTFSHTLEYELANGEQTVSVQYIANTGVAVASSRVLSFIKDDTSTNYIKTATAAPVVSGTHIEETNAYLPAALGVVAFGLLLLYVGRGLRVMQLTNKKVIA